MSKLQILITQYNETEELIKPMLDSIEIQQNLDFNDIEVFIGNDGSDIKLSEDFLKTYHFPIQYHFFPHEGLPGCRKNLFNISSAEYVMFCDADDMFNSTVAISLILTQLKDDLDAFICDFYEEHKLPDGQMFYVVKNNDSVFVHGKIYRRQFLLDNEIVWHPELKGHEDSCFNVLARTLAKKTKNYKIPLYIWKYRENSISRSGIWYLPKTWTYMLDSYDYLITDLSNRGLGHFAIYYSKYALYATYFELAHTIWRHKDIGPYKEAVYQRLRQFYTKYHLLIKNATDEQTETIITTTKGVAEKKGELGDMPPFDEWLNSIILLG